MKSRHSTESIRRLVGHIHTTISSTLLAGSSYNQSNFSKWLILDMAIEDIRNLIDPDIFRMEHIYLYMFNKQVEFAIKYSLANCEERACVALDYFF